MQTQAKRNQDGRNLVEYKQTLQQCDGGKHLDDQHREPQFWRSVLPGNPPRSCGKANQKQRDDDAEGVSAGADDHREDARPRDLRADRDKARHERRKDPETVAAD